MNFVSARKRAGLTQIEVAEKLGVTPAAVCMWESGKAKPRANLLPVLAKLYGCTIDELMAQE